MTRHIMFFYGLAAYLLFIATGVYAIGFVGDLGVPRSINRGLSAGPGAAVAINLLLILVFSLQHSGMARRGFKQLWTRFVVPEAIERSTYVLCASLAVLLLFWQWRPLPQVLWHIDWLPGRIAIYSCFAAGWLLVVAGCAVLNHFDLFGMRQVWMHWHNRAYAPLPFRTRQAYQLVRHPLMLGLMIAFWATPTMTVGQLTLAAGATVYILIAIRLEERDLLRVAGDAYAAYREAIPMLIPNPLRWARRTPTATTNA